MSDKFDNVVYLDERRRQLNGMSDAHKAAVKLKTDGAVFTALLEVLEEYGIDMPNIPADDFMRMVALSDELADVLIRTINYHRGRNPTS